MKQIFAFEVFDIIPCPEGIIISQKELYNGTSYKVSFLLYDINLDRKTPVTRDVYQNYKFGDNYEKLCDVIGDYVSCDVAFFKNGSTVIVYPTGEAGIFDKNAKNVFTADLFYRDCPISSVAADTAQFWTAVPMQNSIISYSIPHKKFSMRIGSENAMTFNEPVSVSRYGSDLYICCAGGCKIRTVSLDSYLADDYRQFDEPVYKYLRSAGKEFVVLSSGVYML
ncbi:MAG: hypothetical protein E7514_03460 [Ruminococcaceae bacterium]|nr:hypothetical protein [Oscillospiraceae bacterium]